jgi:hypothetical protein
MAASNNVSHPKAVAGRAFSIEDSHNSVHVAVGGPMADVPAAAFCPIFFLHHCNVDRVYESYLNVQGHEECLDEFRDFQQWKESGGQVAAAGGNRSLRQWQLPPRQGPNQFTMHYVPFVVSQSGEVSGNSQQGTPFSGRHAFNTQRLLYSYDSLMRSSRSISSSSSPSHSNSLRDPPVVAKLIVHINRLQKRSFTIHMFVCSKGERQGFQVPLRKGQVRWMHTIAFSVYLTDDSSI